MKGNQTDPESSISYAKKICQVKLKKKTGNHWSEALLFLSELQVPPILKVIFRCDDEHKNEEKSGSQIGNKKQYNRFALSKF